MTLPAELPPLASVDELSARTGQSYDGRDWVRAEAALSDASALVRGEAGLDWYDPDTEAITAPGVARAIVLRLAAQVMRNPLGYTSETAGEFTYHLPAGQAGMVLTAADRRVLQRIAVGGSLASVSIERDYLISDAPRVEVAGWPDADAVPWW